MFLETVSSNDFSVPSPRFACAAQTPEVHVKVDGLFFRKKDGRDLQR